jgi:hypothetical protein
MGRVTMLSGNFRLFLNVRLNQKLQPTGALTVPLSAAVERTSLINSPAQNFSLNFHFVSHIFLFPQLLPYCLL